MSHIDEEPSDTATAAAEPLAVITIWVVVFLAAELLVPTGLPDLVVAGPVGGVAFVVSRRYLAARRENES
ncbi:hypothetical protein [Halobaculum marinum]|uniref:Uncharacterized protein n=1 Tax=Halobaculum marinum TaxID=3031996 RepID=A0ABD5X0L8_9EURY|nr:hypothetical protein [Halobaculum sp. DT55]